MGSIGAIAVFVINFRSRFNRAADFQKSQRNSK